MEKYIVLLTCLVGGAVSAKERVTHLNVQLSTEKRLRKLFHFTHFPNQLFARAEGKDGQHSLECYWVSPQKWLKRMGESTGNDYLNMHDENGNTLLTSLLKGCLNCITEYALRYTPKAAAKLFEHLLKEADPLVKTTKDMHVHFPYLKAVPRGSFDLFELHQKMIELLDPVQDAYHRRWMSELYLRNVLYYTCGELYESNPRISESQNLTIARKLLSYADVLAATPAYSGNEYAKLIKQAQTALNDVTRRESEAGPA